MRAPGIALAAAAMMAVPSVAAAQVPTTPPAPTALRPVRFPPFVNARLANGVSLVVVENHEQPVVTVSLAVPAGGRYEPADRSGLAGMVATLLTKGTESRTADQIAAEVEGAGGGIGAGAGNDFLSITVSTLTANLPQAMNVLADVVAHANFPATEVDLARTQALSTLQLTLSQPAAIAQRIFDREVYGEHPYGRSETQASLRAITRDDIVRFFNERVKPAGALLVVAGDVQPAAVRRLASEALGTWQGAPAPAAAEPAVPVRAATEIVLVHKPGAVQSNIVAGFPFITPRDPTFYALTVMNRVLGGGADARLFMILREQKGWTYGAYSGFTRPRGIGRFAATAEVRTPVTDSSLAELLHQLNRIRTETPPDSEITGAKNYLVGRFPLSIETPEEIAGAVASARLLGLPDDYVIRYRERLAAVTAAQIQAAARRHLTTDRMVIVVVGDGPSILNGLKAQGLPVRIVDVEGRPMTEADLTPRADGVAWARERIEPGTVTYRVLLQGNPFGQQTRSISQATEGGRPVLRVITASNLGPIINQSDTTAMDAATLAPLRVRQGGTVQGQATSLSLDYDGMHVRGQGHTPRPGGAARDVTVDTTLAAGTVDNDQLGLLITALPLAAGGRWTFAAFDGAENTVRTMAVSVSGEESVTTPAGTFACWRVEVNGGQIPVVFFVPKEAPYAHVKLELVGPPVVFELTGRN
ncbi:MAG: insulinase family protein [Gemmatimonadales bacterium]|nr:insulinase family protein [Gemmatimonadales bacterium]